MNSNKVKGRLILKEVEFNEIIERKVIKNNESSCKVTLPKNWEGKKVYVVLKDE